MEYNNIKKCKKCQGLGRIQMGLLQQICPDCKGSGRVSCYNIDDIVKIEAIHSMKKSISVIGNKRCWEVIEDLANYRTRTSYRRVFFQAGGKTPESEIK